MAIEENHFRKDLDVEQFAWSMYSYVLGYHHFKRMLDDPKAEVRLKRAFRELVESAKAPVTKTSPRQAAIKKAKKQ
jgi:hypothetical protein